MEQTHLNLDKTVPLSITLSSVGGSSFALYALQHAIREIRRGGRRFEVHLVGAVMVRTLALAQAADHRSIEADAFLMFSEVHGVYNPWEDQVFLARVDQITARARLTREICHEWCSTNATLTALQALEEGLVDEIVPVPPFGPPARMEIVRAPMSLL